MWKPREHIINAVMWAVIAPIVLAKMNVPPEQYFLYLPAIGLCYSYATDYIDTML